MSDVVRDSARTRPSGRHARPLTRRQWVWLWVSGGDPSRPKSGGDRWFGGPVGLLRVLAVCLIFIGWGWLPFDVADQRRAVELEASGRAVTVTEVRVHVGHRSAKGGGWDEVDRVQVRIHGVADGGWVDVYGLNNLEMNPSAKGTLWRGGWQEPTGATSYQPPLEVVYRVGRNVDVMTPGDIARWSTTDDVQFFASIGLAGVAFLGLTVLQAGVTRLRARARDRRRR